MVARNFSIQELTPYSRLLQIPDDDGEFLTLEELKPSSMQQQTTTTTTLHHQQPYQPSYYELSNMIEWVFKKKLKKKQPDNPNK